MAVVADYFRPPVMHIHQRDLQNSASGIPRPAFKYRVSQKRRPFIKIKITSDLLSDDREGK